MHTKHTNGKLARWAIKLSEYDFDIIHKPGRAMTNVDALGRLFPKSNQNRPDKAVENGIHLLLVNYAFSTRSEIASAQKNDPPLRRLIDFLESDGKWCDEAHRAINESITTLSHSRGFIIPCRCFRLRPTHSASSDT